MINQLLKFSINNSKLKKVAKFLGLPVSKIVAFNIPAGWTCPGANICLSRCYRYKGTIKDAKGILFRCYAASLEAAFPSLRRQVWHNFDLLKLAGLNNLAGMVNLIERSILDIPLMQFLRIHSHGDFFNQVYFNAWLEVVKNNSSKLFYAYTKNTPVLPSRNSLPHNFKIVVSHGGKFDNLALDYPRGYVADNLFHARVLSKQYGGIPICENEILSEVYNMLGLSFIMLLHCTQPKEVNQRIKEE